MKDNVFIKAYVDARQEQYNRRMAWLKQAAEDGKAKFMDNCKVWLGEMWAECEIGAVMAVSNDGERISFALPLVWAGVNGEIVSGLWGRETEIPAHYSGHPIARLHFWMGKSHEYRSFDSGFDLPRDLGNTTGGMYTEVARQPDSYRIGEFLLEIAGKVEAYDRAQTERAEQAKQNTYNRLSWDLCNGRDKDAVHLAYQECMTAMPESQTQWDQQKQKRLAELTELENQRAQAAREQAEYLAARQELEALAESSFKPFVLFRVRYGATVQVIDYGEDGTEKEFHEVEDYSQTAEPDDEGWWTFLRWGQACRVKIARLIAVEEHPVNRAYDVPPATLKRAYVRSERYPEMSEETWDLTVLGL